MSEYLYFHSPFPAGSLENNHRWRHSYIILHYLTFPFEISSPCTTTELPHMGTRLYNAAASPASRLRSAGSLAINPKFFTLYNYYITKRGSILSIFHGGQQLHFFKKSSIRLPVSWNISITAKKKKTFLLMDSKCDRYLQWLPTMIRNENSLLSMTLLQLCQR